MARLSLTRLELKRQRERLVRFERFLPALKLRQQQLQLRLHEADVSRVTAQERLDRASAMFDAYRPVLADLAGMDVLALAEPVEVSVSWTNVAGVRIPVLEAVRFWGVAYSLFGTPPWVDRVLEDLRTLSRYRAERDVLEQQCGILRRELLRVLQRVNLFERVKIPEAREAIHRIRTHLGDEMAAAVGRSKIAKGRRASADLADREPVETGGSVR